MIFLGFLFLSCSNEPQTLPTEKQLEPTQADPPPVAYQLLYDSPGLPKPTEELQRLKILLWIQRMNLRTNQLNRLESLRQEVVERQKKIDSIEREESQKIVDLEKPIYNALWDLLKSGQTIDENNEQISQLQEIRQSSNRDKDLLSMRVEGIRSILDGQQEFMRTLTPNQEQVIPDALFFLRHHLDPIANPKDFSILVGTTYEPGQYAVLTRGTDKIARQTMNIGGLWSDNAELTGKDLHEARREVLIYLILLEPGLEEAIRTAIELR